jgi:hypothetical protein
MLSAIGVPPDASLYVTVAAQQVKFLLGMMFVLVIVRTQRARYLRLSPGEQIRRHYRDGGYLP